METDWINGLIGGLMIGAAAAILLLGNGKIAGISGIVGTLLRPTTNYRGKSDAALFVIGLILAPLLYELFAGPKEIFITANLPLLILAGLLVGFGTRMGSGCTSGHGVCGVSRFSLRSIIAMLVFMATAILTVMLGKLV